VLIQNTKTLICWLIIILKIKMETSTGGIGIK
jgi:hypothetical protein